MHDTASRAGGPRRARALSPFLSLLLALASAVALAVPAGALAGTFLGRFSTVGEVASTVPENGDVNPYGVAVVPASTGALVRGDVLVSNFNDAGNEQGTGTTIVQVSPAGQQSLFSRIEASALPGPCPGGVGLTTALAVLPGGFVVVGSLPTSDGSAATAQAGCLIVLDSRGQVLRTIAGGPIDGPWDMTAVSDGAVSDLFVANVLNGTVAGNGEPTPGGTVVRIGLLAQRGRIPQVLSERVIAAGFGERTDEAALVIGPTGLGLGRDGTLYVADTLGNRIAAIPDALLRRGALGHGGVTLTQNGLLHGPLGLAIAPNGDVLTTNGGNGDVVETTPSGVQLPPLVTEDGEGGLFGLAVAPGGNGLYLADDADNTLQLAH